MSWQAASIPLFLFVILVWVVEMPLPRHSSLLPRAVLAWGEEAGEGEPGVDRWEHAAGTLPAAAAPYDDGWAACRLCGGEEDGGVRTR